MILNRQRTVRVAQRPLTQFLARVQRELGITEADVTICLVSDAEIARMNQVFRKKKGPTDILSFPAIERVNLRLHREARTPNKPYDAKTANSIFSGRRRDLTFHRASQRQKTWSHVAQ